MFNHIHSSVLVGRPDSDVLSQAMVYNSEADLVTYTGIGRSTYGSTLNQSAEASGFQLVIPFQTNAITFKSERFRLMGSECIFIGYVYRKGVRESLFATTASLLDLRKDKVFVVSVAELPATSLRDWRKALGRWKHVTNSMSKKFDAEAVVLTGDLGLNLRKTSSRMILKTFAPSYTLTYGPDAFNYATKSIMDGTLIRGDIGHFYARVYRDDTREDHQPFTEGLKLLPRRT